MRTQMIYLQFAPDFILYFQFVFNFIYRIITTLFEKLLEKIGVAAEQV